MAVTLIPFGPDLPPALLSPLQALYDAVASLQNPDGPSDLAHVATLADLSTYPAATYPGAFMICDQINSIVHSTLVTGAYAWLRADGSAL